VGRGGSQGVAPAGEEDWGAAVLVAKAQDDGCGLGAYASLRVWFFVEEAEVFGTERFGFVWVAVGVSE
jgi:hypothetical protein